MVTAAFPMDAVQEAASRMFPRDEASQTDLVSHAWERWERNGVRDVALLIHAGKHFAFRMRKKERSPLSWPMEDLDKCISAIKPDTWPQELISGLPDHLRIVATLLAAGHNRAECARLLDVSKASIWRQCREIAAHLRPLCGMPRDNNVRRVLLAACDAICSQVDLGQPLDYESALVDAVASISANHTAGVALSHQVDGAISRAFSARYRGCQAPWQEWAELPTTTHQDVISLFRAAMA